MSHMDHSLLYAGSNHLHEDHLCFKGTTPTLAALLRFTLILQSSVRIVIVKSDILLPVGSGGDVDQCDR